MTTDNYLTNAGTLFPSSGTLVARMSDQ